MTMVDVVTVEVLRNAFNSIASQMNGNMARSAYSPIIYEMKDCSVALFDEHAQMLGQSNGLPVFLGSLEAAVRAIVDHVGLDAMRPGDAYLLNDSYIVGSHLNDVSVVSPVFLDGQVVGFGSTKAHWIDVGAKSPSQAMDSTDIYQEGLRLGPTRVWTADGPEEAIVDLICRNSRVPKAIRGDLGAQIVACRTGERELVKLIRRFGLDVVRSAAQEIFAQSERADRGTVAAMPDGTWSATGALDSWGPGGGPVPVCVAVTIAGDEMVLDLRGSAPQSPGCVNCGLAQTIAAARLAFKFVVNPDLSVTAGSFRNLTVLTDERSVFDAREPAACQYYYPHLGLMIDLFLKAMAGAVPDRVVAGQPSDAMNILFTGHDDDGVFMSGEATAVGWGAWSGGDGSSALINYGGGDLKNLPVEVQEVRYPLRIDRYALRPDSGGAGRWRGGLGIERSYEVLTDDVLLSTWFERTATPGWGLDGGAEGRVADVIVEQPDGTVLSLLKASGVASRTGTRVTIRTGGGGGFGDPALRPPEEIAEDLIDGYVTAWPTRQPPTERGPSC
jgi:N-methylhydantoinase B